MVGKLSLKPCYLRKINNDGNMSFRKFSELGGHYVLVIPLKIKTAKERDKFIWHCKKDEFAQFSFLGKSLRIYTNGYTKKIKPMIPAIINNVLNDCIKNPRKYLEDDEDEKRNI